MSQHNLKYGDNQVNSQKKSKSGKQEEVSGMRKFISTHNRFETGIICGLLLPGISALVSVASIFIR